VLRDKVPEVLRPLCVAVLGSDHDARRQLETSIGSITERLTTQTSESLDARAAGLRQRRKELLTESKVLQRDLRESLENEYRELVVDGRRFTPADAARYVKAHNTQDAWIPGPVKLATPTAIAQRAAEPRRSPRGQHTTSQAHGSGRTWNPPPRQWRQDCS